MLFIARELVRVLCMLSNKTRCLPTPLSETYISVATVDRPTPPQSRQRQRKPSELSVSVRVYCRRPRAFIVLAGDARQPLFRNADATKTGRLRWTLEHISDPFDG